MTPNLKKLKSFPTTNALRQISKIRKESGVFFPDLPGINLSDNDKKVAILISYLDIFPTFLANYEDSIIAYNENSTTHYIKFVDFDENTSFPENSKKMEPLRLMFNEKEFQYTKSFNDDDLLKFESVFETFIAGMVIFSTVKKFKSQEQMNAFFRKRFTAMFHYIGPTNYTVEPADCILEQIGDLNDWNLLPSYCSSETDLKSYMMVPLIETWECKKTHEYLYIYKLATGREKMILKIADEFLKSEDFNLKGIVDVVSQFKVFKEWRSGQNEQMLSGWFHGQSKWICSFNALRSFYTLAVNWKKSKDKNFKYPGVKGYAFYEKWKLKIDNRLVKKFQFDRTQENYAKTEAEMKCNKNLLVLPLLLKMYKRELAVKPRALSASEWKMIAHVSQLLLEIHQKGGRTADQKIVFAHSNDFLEKVGSKLEIPTEKGIDISSLISIKLAKFEYDFNKKNHEKFVVKEIVKNPNLRSDLLDVGLEIAYSAIEDDLLKLVAEITAKKNNWFFIVHGVNPIDC